MGVYRHVIRTLLKRDFPRLPFHDGVVAPLQHSHTLARLPLHASRTVQLCAIASQVCTLAARSCTLVAHSSGRGSLNPAL